MSIKPTSIFSGVFRRKFNAHKYAAVTQPDDGLQALFSLTRSAYLSRGLHGVAVFGAAFLTFYSLQKSHFFHELLGDDFYPHQASRAFAKLPAPAERDFYRHFSHAAHTEQAWRLFEKSLDLLKKD